MNNSTTEQRTTFIALAGAPNAGKSTLVNTLIGQKITIVTPKEQTTRDEIKAIMMVDNTQIVFSDLPGIFEASNKFEEKLVSRAMKGIKSNENIALIIDVLGALNPQNRRLYELAKTLKLKPIVVLNKVDLVTKTKLATIIESLQDLVDMRQMLTVSCKTGEGLEEFKVFLTSLALTTPWPYDPEDLTDRPLRFIAEEMVREKVFFMLAHELPYSIKVETETIKEEENSMTMHLNIKVLKESQKLIVIGQNAQMIKKIGTAARLELEKLLGHKVNLFLHVQVRPNWQDHEKG